MIGLLRDDEVRRPSRVRFPLLRTQRGLSDLSGQGPRQRLLASAPRTRRTGERQAGRTPPQNVTFRRRWPYAEWRQPAFPSRFPAAGQKLTCGAFTPQGEFLELPELDLERLRTAWQEAVFALYLAEGKVEPEVVENLRTWPHSGFSVDQSGYLPAGDRAGIERLVGYMTRCPFSLSRLVKVSETGQVVYKAESGRIHRAAAERRDREDPAALWAVVSRLAPGAAGRRRCGPRTRTKIRTAGRPLPTREREQMFVDIDTFDATF